MTNPEIPPELLAVLAQVWSEHRGRPGHVMLRLDFGPGSALSIRVMRWEVLVCGRAIAALDDEPQSVVSSARSYPNPSRTSHPASAGHQAGREASPMDGGAGSGSETADRITPAVRRYLDALAELRGLPPWTLSVGEVYLPGEWLEGLVLAESGGDVHARRYEPHHDRETDGDLANTDDGDWEDDASWGPCQVLGSTARALLGLAPMSRINWRVLLCTWDRGVLFGVWLLADNLRAAGSRLDWALAHYNGGPRGNPGVDGMLRNAAYVDRIRVHAARAKADRARATTARDVRIALGGSGR